MIPKVYGIIGYPVKHSLSPAMHNAAFHQLHINAKYKLFERKPEELIHFLQSLTRENICGFNVTIPHKETMVGYMDKLTEEASLVGAVNTVKVDNQTLIGHNTDGLGFIKHLMDTHKTSIYAKIVSLLGAGGAARAVAQYLAAEGVGKIIVYDIKKEKSESLARKIMDNFESVEVEVSDSADALLLANPDLFINATHVGMNESDPLLINPGRLNHSTFVYDLIYSPEETKLLRAAKSKGCACANGLGMLLYQGVLSFEFWTGQKPPIEIMRKALVEAIAK